MTIYMDYVDGPLPNNEQKKPTLKNKRQVWHGMSYITSAIQEKTGSMLLLMYTHS